jgi:hypothetical protein
MHLKSLHRAWYNIKEYRIAAVLDEHGIYDHAFDVWWFKLKGVRKSLTDSMPELTPCGGVGTKFGATYFAECVNGKIEQVRKNSHTEINFTDLYQGNAEVAAKIRERVEKKRKHPIFRPPEELHSIRYGVLQPHMAIGKHTDDAWLDVDF